MNVFTKRNAAVGFITLKALSRYLDRKRSRRQRAPRIALYAGLGLVSLGLLAGLAYHWRQHSATTAQALEEAGETPAGAADQLTEEAAAAAAEPVPAT